MPKKSIKYSFPILNVNEIVKCMRELGIEVAQADLKTPTEERMRYIYSEVLRNLMAVNINHGADNFHLLRQSVEYPQLHEHSFGTVILVKNLIKFMQRFGVKDFNMGDIIVCESTRTIRNLSAIINFAKFRMEKWKFHEGFRQRQSEVNKNFEKERKENVELGDKFAAQQKYIEDSKSECESIRKEIAGLETEIDGLTKQTMANKKDGREIKKELKVVEQKKKEIVFNGQKMAEEMMQVERKIVRSPQKIKDTIDLRKKKLKQLEHESAELTNVIKMYEFRMSEYLNFMKSFDAAFLSAQSLVNHEDNLRLVLDEYQKTEQLLEEKKRDYDRLKEETNEIFTEMKNVNSLLSSTKKEFDDKRSACVVLKRAAEEKLQTVLKQQKAKIDTVSKLVEDLKGVNEELESQMQYYRQQLVQVHAKMENLAHSHSTFCEEILSALDNK